MTGLGEGPKTSALLLLDVATAVLFTLTVGPAIVVASAFHRAVSSEAWWQWLWLPIDAIVFALAFCAAIACVRLCLPKLTPGLHPLSGGKGVTTWGLHFALMRVGYMPVWKHFIFAFTTLRWCLLTALGAKVALRMNTASDAQVIDPSLVEIGEGAMLAAGVIVSGHVAEEGQLKLARVTIGKGAQLLSGVKGAPGIRIGADAPIGPESVLGPDAEIGAETHLGVMAQIAGGARIGSNVVLGHHVKVEPGVVIEDGAVIASDTLVPRNTHVPVGGRYPPRAVASKEGSAQ
jgi:acetyltransferase-like isoleucine patch superfamily enzyme